MNKMDKITLISFSTQKSIRLHVSGRNNWKTYDCDICSKERTHLKYSTQELRHYYSVEFNDVFLMKIR
jgi:hypothetical protein